MIESPPFWMYIIGFLLLLGPLVTIHEFGHYLVGRWFGVGAQAFSVGFGKEIAGFTDKRGTRWKLSLLPLGGYVQFKGDMNPASMPDRSQLGGDGNDATFGMGAEESEADRNVVGNSFHHASLGKRALIVFAGPATNLLLTIGIFAAFFFFWGKPVPADVEDQLTIASFAEDSPAREAGLQIGDRIIAVEGVEMTGFRELQQAVFMYPDRALDVTFSRNGATDTISITTTSTEIEDRFGNASKIGLIGIAPVSESPQYDYEEQGFFQSLAMGVDESWRITKLMVTGVKQIFTGERSVKELGGPIKIAKYSGEQFSLGPMAFVSFMALISLNLAFINLLPIPALDGGHLAFYAAEAIRRKPIGPRGQEWAFRTGIALVLALMLFVTVNDIVSLPFFSS